ncbi:hypothetical protein [Microbulbifer variabilis]|uniref:hypothetical protein n=1 Tax=Microbulbifer variabilis TaxID=266805 RepID=UPI001CFD4A39|nr:hypothetical protein [Microbulbifer variabilis]
MKSLYTWYSVSNYFRNFLKVGLSKPDEVGSSILSPKSQDVIIHIGAPKAGSSAIQKFCKMNRDKLAKYGYFYPFHSLDVNNVSGGHSILEAKLVEGDLEGVKKILQKWIDTAKKYNMCLLLSSESIYGRANDLASILAGQRVKIFAYYRSPISALFSHYNQSVKRNLNKGFLTNYVDLILEGNQDRYSGGFIRLWIDRFGSKNVTVYPYQDVRDKSCNIEQDFLCYLGISKRTSCKFAFSEKAVNSSYSLGALELKRQLNFILPDADLSLQNEIDWCLQKYSDELGLPTPRLIELIPLEKFKELQEKFSVTNKYMKDNVLAYCPENFFDESLVDGGDGSTGSSEHVHISALIDAARAIDKNPEAKKKIKNLISIRLSNLEEINLTIFRLADIFGVPYQDPIISKFKYTERQIRILSASTAGGADICRETALALEANGEYVQACFFIKKALELRPNGRVIQDIYKRLCEYNF